MSIAIGSGRAETDQALPRIAAPGRRLRRGLLAAALVAGAGAAAYAAGAPEVADAASRAGGELTRLLRFMALIKAAMAATAMAAVWWRLAFPATARWTLAYAAAGAAAAAGPVLVWTMSHLGLGSVLLHGGLFGTLALLWRDPAVAAGLSTAIAARRRTLAPVAEFSAGAPSERRAPPPCRFPPAR